LTAPLRALSPTGLLTAMKFPPIDFPNLSSQRDSL
jgi:hypothetical protein